MKNKNQQKNWLGIKIHDTDGFIHWRTEESEVLKIRNLYNSILVEEPSLKKTIDELLEKIWSEGFKEGQDAGDILDG